METKSSDLIQKAQAGSRVAFNALVGQWYGRIYNFAYKYFADHDVASEVSQKTFISVHKHLKKLRETNKFRPWIYQIASNHCHEERKRNQRRATVPLYINSNEEEETTPQEVLELANQARPANPAKVYQQNELKHILQKALAQINEEQRIIVIMKEYEGLKFREIAEALQISENTAKSRLYYGLKALQKILKQWNINPETIHYEL